MTDKQDEPIYLQLRVLGDRGWVRVRQESSARVKRGKLRYLCENPVNCRHTTLVYTEHCFLSALLMK